MPSTKIPLGQYIFRRIQQLGIQHIFGCPGDFNLNLLDHLYETGGLKWVGNCNELNAAYAADGYGRSRGGLPGVVITTFCVGELSAINGIGGAYAEFIPIIHIVGTTSRAAQAQRLMIHHVLEENWDHTTLQTVSKAVSTATAFLTDDATFIHEVDRVIETSVKTRRPVYLYVPMDVPDLLVDADQLDQPLDLSIRNVGQEGLEDAIVAKILAELERATKPCLLVDALTQRYTVTNEVQQILQLTQLPVS
jgi:pyruvate decarboxylase